MLWRTCKDWTEANLKAEMDWWREQGETLAPGATRIYVNGASAIEGHHSLDAEFNPDARRGRGVSDEPLPRSEIILYQTEDGRTRVQCRIDEETLWLTQAQIAELFEKDVRTINGHLMNIFDEGELRREATIRKFPMVRSEGESEAHATCKSRLQVQQAAIRKLKATMMMHDRTGILERRLS